MKLLIMQPFNFFSVPNSLLNTLFSVYVPPLISETAFHNPYKTTGKIIVLYLLVFTFIDSRLEDKKFWTER
jgi:hypothetical protein